MSAALTGGETGPGTDSSQRGAVVRVAGRTVQAQALAVHLGLSGVWPFQPLRDAGGERALTLSECQSAPDRDPGSAPKRDPCSLR